MINSFFDVQRANILNFTIKTIDKSFKECYDADSLKFSVNIKMFLFGGLSYKVLSSKCFCIFCIDLRKIILGGTLL